MATTKVVVQPRVTKVVVTSSPTKVQVTQNITKVVSQPRVTKVVVQPRVTKVVARRGLDAAFRPWTDLGTVATSFNIGPTVLIRTALQAIPIEADSARTYNLDPGVYTMPTTLKCQNQLTWRSAMLAGSTLTIASIGASSRATGLSISFSGTPFTPGAEVGKFWLFETGTMAGKYGVIYDNTDDTLTISQDTNFNGSFALPAVSDTGHIESVQSFLRPSGTSTTMGANMVCFFDGIGFDDDSKELAAISTDQIAFDRCAFTNRFINVGGFGRIRLGTCYVAPDGRNASVGMLAVRNKAHMFFNRGTVFDGLNADAGQAFIDTTLGASLQTDSQVVFWNFESKGLSCHGTDMEVRRGTGDHGWYFNGAFKISHNVDNDRGVGGNLDIPDLFGTTSESYILAAQRAQLHRIGGASVVTTALGAGAFVSADGGATNTAGREIDGTVIFGGNVAPT